jgi:hypothetical protein
MHCEWVRDAQNFRRLRMSQHTTIDPALLEPNSSETDWWRASDGLWYPPCNDLTYGVPHYRYPWEYLGPDGSELGTVRDPSMVVVLSIITLGIYGLYWQYSMFKELKRYSGGGLGGWLGLLLAFFLGVVTAFVLPSEIGQLYERDGQIAPVSVTTGFWHLIPFVGWIVWIIKVQRSVNTYWDAHHALPGKLSANGSAHPI